MVKARRMGTSIDSPVVSGLILFNGLSCGSSAVVLVPAHSHSGTFGVIPPAFLYILSEATQDGAAAKNLLTT
jgi:hypothetical protein